MPRPVRAIVFGVLLSACGTCGSCSGSEVEGDHPFVRCAQLEADSQVLEASGQLRVEVEEHTVEITSADEFVVADVFAVGGAVSFEGEAPPLQIALGGFARQGNDAVAMLRALSARAPTLLLAGGEDDLDVLDAALEELDDERLIDLRGIRVLTIAGHAYAVVAGAPAGRYASARGCGVAEEDLSDLAEAGEGATLLSWAMPRGAEGDLDRAYGVNMGHPWLTRLVEDAGFVGGIHAWPRDGAGRFEEGVAVVPMLGQFVVTEHGSRIPSGVMRLRLGPAGPAAAE